MELSHVFETVNNNFVGNSNKKKKQISKEKKKTDANMKYPNPFYVTGFLSLCFSQMVLPAAISVCVSVCLSFFLSFFLSFSLSLSLPLSLSHSLSGIENKLSC